MFPAMHSTFESSYKHIWWNFMQKSMWRLLLWLQKLVTKENAHLICAPVQNANQITKRTQWACLSLLLCAEQSLCPKIVRSLGCTEKAGAVFGHSILLSNHKIRGPSGKEQSTEQHCVAEENEFQYFLESAEEADKQGLRIQIQIQRLVLLLRPRHVLHVCSPTHSARTKMSML